MKKYCCLLIAALLCLSSMALAQEQPSFSVMSPLFASSVDECTDTSKLYVLPDGYL